MAEPANEPLPVAYVEWLDSAVLSNGWEDRVEVIGRAAEMQAKPIQSAGLLLAQDEHTITLALSLSPYRDDVAEVMTIPRAVIRKMSLWNPRPPAELEAVPAR